MKKKKKKMKELLTRADPYKSLSLTMLMMKYTRLFHARNDVIHVRTL